MKKYISLILIMTVLIPSVALGHSDHESHNQQAQLEKSINAEDINVDQFKDTIDGASETISLFQKALSIGSEIFSIAKDIIDVIDGWLQDTIGLSLVELIKSLFTAVVKILEVILDLLRNIIPS